MTKTFSVEPTNFAPCTEAIQQAIDDLHANGGGVLSFPRGTYLTGMLRLRSHVHLYLDEGAVLLGSREESDYQILREKPFGEKPGVIRTLVFAEGAKDIGISGKGTIDGNFPEPLKLPEAKEVTFRPELIFMVDCEGISMTGVTLRNSGFWCLHLMHCQHVELGDLTIRTPLGRINTDGIDPDGCSDMTITNCDIETGDDCIVLKSTEGRPCERIHIADCILRTNHGALKIGTEAMGPIRDVTVERCHFPSVGQRKTSGVGIALYMKDGTTYENMHFRDIRMENMPHLAVLVDNRPRYRETDKPGQIRNIAFENIQVSGSGRMLFEGREGSPIENLLLQDITFAVDTFELKHDKPLGSARTDHDPALPNFLPHPYQLIFAHVAEARLNKIHLHTDDASQQMDRGLLYLHDASECRIEGMCCKRA